MFTTLPNAEKRVANTTRSGIFLPNFDVFENVVKHYLESLIDISIDPKTKKKTEKSVLIHIRYPNAVTVMISFV